MNPIAEASPCFTIALCCHNSEERITETLRHLVCQKGLAGVTWEVLVINNASTDATSAVASEVWKKEVATGRIDAVTFRVIDEPRSGLSHARARAFQAAKGAVVCFLDDDNWAPPHWLSKVQEIFKQHPEVAAAGGPISEVLEKEPPPEWFERFKGNFTIWNPRDSAGYWDQPLCGAGLCVRKAAWEKLRAEGFHFQLSDRSGKNLSSGGDFELCYALLLAGWKLWYDPALHIKHWMPANRITWNNLLRLNRGFGEQSVVFDAYRQEGSGSWKIELMKTLCALASLILRVQLKNHSPMHQSLKGRLIRLWKEKKNYDKRVTGIVNASWRQ